MVRILRFLVQRMLFLIPIGIGIVTLTFLLGNVIPSNPVRAAVGPQASEETIAKIKHEFGLDKPLPEQYLTFWERLLHGDLGKSLLTRRSVSEDLSRRVPASVELAIVSMIVGVVPGIILGVVSAVRRDRFLDYFSRFLAVVGVSSPQFWTGLVLQLIVASILALLPITGRIGSGLAPTRITGLYLVDSLLTGDFEAFVSSVKHIILPAVTLSLPLWAIVARLTRSGMLDVLQRDYVMNARVAAGLPEQLVVYKYTLKNALIGTTSQIGLNFGSLLSGAVIVETIFDWPGLGLYVVHGAINQDLRPIMATTLLVSVIYVVVNAFTDLVYTFLDPRIKV